MELIKVLAAKSDINNPSKYLSFEIHSEDTGRMICKLYDMWLPQHIKHMLSGYLCQFGSFDEDKVRSFLRLIAYLHDIGKLTPAFQYKISNSIDGYSEFVRKEGLEIGNISEFRESPHALAGKCILEYFEFPLQVTDIIGSHHGKGVMGLGEDYILKYPSNFFGPNKKQKKDWINIWKTWIDHVLEKTGFLINELPCPNIEAQMIVTGLLIMADWIASNTYYYPYMELGEYVADKDIAERSNTAWTRLGLPMSLEIDKCCKNQELFKERFGFEANSVQKDVVEIVVQNTEPGIYIIEAPMGVGKTEAALATAEILIDKFEEGGVYFGLPTQATANGIFGRIKEWAQGCDPEMHSIRLAHGMTDLNEEYRALFHGTATETDDENLVVHTWFEGRKQALLSDFVIATVDQFLLASLKQKHVMLRHLGLAGKVIIIDECHAYDAYMNVYLDNSLRWMSRYKVPVIILSATLPPERRKELLKAYCGRKVLKKNTEILKGNEYPVITYSCDGIIKRKKLGSDIKDKRVKVGKIDERSLPDYFRNKLNNSGCGAVIVNSVVYAQRIAKILMQQLQDYEIICFHSRFVATDRAAIEKELLRRLGNHSSVEDRKKVIVVGTQVLEQSLDIDFDVMITELCPMDLLLQRIGRLQRHSRRTERPDSCKYAEIIILEPEAPVKSVYSDWILQQTQKYIPKEFNIPSCIPELVSRVYDTSTENTEEYEKYMSEIKEKRIKAEKYCMSFENDIFISDIMNNEAENTEKAEATVRDTDESFEIIVLKRISETLVSTMSGKYVFDLTTELNDGEDLNIARERIRLPYIFAAGKNWDNTYKELAPMPLRWKKSSMISRELLLIFNDSMETVLIGKKLRYSREYGLEVVNEEKG